MIDLFVKKFFENFVKTQVYHLSYQLVHMKVLHAKGFHFLTIFSHKIQLLSKNRHKVIFLKYVAKSYIHDEKDDMDVIFGFLSFF